MVPISILLSNIFYNLLILFIIVSKLVKQKVMFALLTSNSGALVYLVYKQGIYMHRIVVLEGFNVRVSYYLRLTNMPYCKQG